jgi:hypothetical protein
MDLLGKPIPPSADVAAGGELGRKLDAERERRDALRTELERIRAGAGPAG